MRAAGRTDRASWSNSRPPAVEIEAVERAAYWAGVTGGNLHVVHVTVPEAFATLAHARRTGAHVTGETCPHYLCLDETDFERLGPSAKCAPPLRSRRNVEALWSCVFDGLVETIGSDHSPCPWEDKARGLDNIWQAWGGISGVQTMLPVLLTEGVHKRGLPLPTLARLTATNPARLFGLYPHKGALLPGADADLAVVDLDQRWTLEAADLLYKNKYSAYVGREFQGRVLRTFVRGVEVYGAGHIQVAPGFGRLVVRRQRYGIEASQ
jgi:allantoinase